MIRNCHTKNHMVCIKCDCKSVSSGLEFGPVDYIENGTTLQFTTLCAAFQTSLYLVPFIFGHIFNLTVPTSFKTVGSLFTNPDVRMFSKFQHIALQSIIIITFVSVLSWDCVCCPSSYPAGSGQSLLSSRVLLNTYHAAGVSRRRNQNCKNCFKKFKL